MTIVLNHELHMLVSAIWPIRIFFYQNQIFPDQEVNVWIMEIRNMISHVSHTPVVSAWDYHSVGAKRKQLIHLQVSQFSFTCSNKENYSCNNL